MKSKHCIINEQYYISVYIDKCECFSLPENVKTINWTHWIYRNIEQRKGVYRTIKLSIYQNEIYELLFSMQINGIFPVLYSHLLRHFYS